MKKSIKFRLFISIILIIIVSNFIGFMINNKLYGELYLKAQREKILDSAIKIEKVIGDEEARVSIINKISENNGYIIQIHDLEFLENTRGKREGLGGRMSSSVFYSQYDDAIKEGHNYVIYFNEVYESNFLRLIYMTDEKSMLIIETPIQLLNTSKKLNSDLFMITTSISILITIVFSYFFSKKFTKPILNISEQAKNISKLEFSDRYVHKHNRDEIDLLGKNMNFLSAKLKNTIEELNFKIEKLEKMEDSRKELIANISHELKTPIALIKGYAEGLKYGISEEKGVYEDIIIDETEKMNNLVKELLNLSEIEAGNVSLHISNFDISSLIDDILFKYNMIFNEKKIRLTVKKEDIVEVDGDIQKIEEVITNFINNAIDHIDNEKIIDIKLFENEEKTRFEIYNSGINIDNENIDDIWTSFFRADKSRNREMGSTGLGLFIVKTIIEKHKGRYGVINRKNGVVFYFEI